MSGRRAYRIVAHLAYWLTLVEVIIGVAMLLDNDGRGAILAIAGVLMFVTIRPTIAKLCTDRQRITS